MEHLKTVSEVKLSYHSKVKPSERPQISSSREANDILQKLWDDDIEHIESVKLLLLNKSNKVLGIATISKGGVSSSALDPKIVFQYAIKANASNIILAHNHPSGTLTPSTSDKRITNKIKNGGGFLDIDLLDHLIISPGGEYYSFADNGII
jgi:DNA repair protein RadC